MKIYIIYFFIFIFFRIFFYYIYLFFFFWFNFFFEFVIFNLNIKLNLFFLFDWMRFLFISFVLIISRIVIFYRIYYIQEDLIKNRFLILVNLFIFSIIIMILSPNLFRILLGWDGLGLVSYCLVIYFQNFKSFNAGIITALYNRVGDCFILLSIIFIIEISRLNFIFFQNSLIQVDKNLLFLLITAAITKRAQIPFSSWLPAAMAAPTPVSALVHSSTLVTAGVYLLIRFYNFIINYEKSMILLLFIGRLTILMSGINANYEIDFKKIIALSTLSQLGLIIGVLSIGLIKFSFFHLLIHALFKALLFLCAGVFIHRIINFQDIRVSGGFNNQLIIVIIFFNISRLALSGIPFLAGFYRKDLILEFILISNFNLLIFFFFLVLV